MLLHDDVDSLLETGSGTPDEAALMVRCYELAAMELWDESALIEAATVAGMDDGFTLSGESPERIQRKITIAIKTKSAPEYMPPPDGIKLLYRLGVLLYDELEETVTRLAAIGRYDTTEPQQKAPVTDNATLAPVVPIGDEKPWLLTDPQDPAPMQPWYTPARYFARQLAIEKPTLLATRELLAEKVSTALFNAGYKKRGGKHKFGSGTVLKAFANVTLG